jgi:5'(3')-deoxyribonucleotidase
MKPLKLGLDLDGVFANFNDAFAEQLITTTGKNPFPADWRPQVWDWMTPLGYSKREIEQTWAAVDTNPLWWAELASLEWAQHALIELSQAVARQQIEIVFLTTRHSPTAHWQSVEWLRTRFALRVMPQVCICKNPESKGLMAKALGLEIVLDDYAPNLLAVKRHSPETRVVILDQPWNAAPLDRVGLRVLSYEHVSNLVEFLKRVDETLNGRG